MGPGIYRIKKSPSSQIQMETQTGRETMESSWKDQRDARTGSTGLRYSSVLQEKPAAGTVPVVGLSRHRGPRCNYLGTTVGRNYLPCSWGYLSRFKELHSENIVIGKRSQKNEYLAVQLSVHCLLISCGTFMLWLEADCDTSCFQKLPI